MTRLKAGNTLWTFGANGGLMSFEVISSCYSIDRGIIVTCWNNQKPERTKPQQISINRYGFMFFDNANERSLSERTTEWWAKVYLSRRAAIRRMKSKNPTIIAFDQTSDKWPLSEAAKEKGLRLKLIPFLRRDVAGRSERVLERMFARAEERARSEPRKQIVMYGPNGQLIREEVI